MEYITHTKKSEYFMQPLAVASSFLRESKLKKESHCSLRLSQMPLQKFHVTVLKADYFEQRKKS